MSEIEMVVEALKKCVDSDAFAKAMREIQGGDCCGAECSGACSQ